MINGADSSPSMLDLQLEAQQRIGTTEPPALVAIEGICGSLNGESIAFEVALEALGQSRQPFMQAIAMERAKPSASAALIRYCEARLAAIDALQEDLRPADIDTVRRILARDPLFITGLPA